MWGDLCGVEDQSLILVPAIASDGLVFTRGSTSDGVDVIVVFDHGGT